MRKFTRDSGRSSGRSGGRSSGRSNRRDSGRSSRRDSGRGDFEKPTMHEVTCDKCGQTCEVPFKPTGGKPVYCSDCFKKEGGSESSSRGRGHDSRSSFRRESNKPLADLQQINEKLDKILEILSDN